MRAKITVLQEKEIRNPDRFGTGRAPRMFLLETGCDNQRELVLSGQATVLIFNYAS